MFAMIDYVRESALEHPILETRRRDMLYYSTSAPTGAGIGGGGGSIGGGGALRSATAGVGGSAGVGGGIDFYNNEVHPFVSVGGGPSSSGGASSSALLGGPNALSVHAAKAAVTAMHVFHGGNVLSPLAQIDKVELGVRCLGLEVMSHRSSAPLFGEAAAGQPIRGGLTSGVLRGGSISMMNSTAGGGGGSFRAAAAGGGGGGGMMGAGGNHNHLFRRSTSPPIANVASAADALNARHRRRRRRLGTDDTLGTNSGRRGGDHSADRASDDDNIREIDYDDDDEEDGERQYDEEDYYEEYGDEEDYDGEEGEFNDDDNEEEEGIPLDQFDGPASDGRQGGSGGGGNSRSRRLSFVIDGANADDDGEMRASRATMRL